MQHQNDSQSTSYAFAPSVADSADWSQYSETDSVYNGRTSPDPFDTSNVLTPPSVSRYYSVVPQQQQISTNDEIRQQHVEEHKHESIKVPESIIREFDTLNVSSSEGLNSSGSPMGNELSNSTLENPAPQKIVKPPLELLKKRDEAFSWLDDTIGIGSTHKVEEMKKPDSVHHSLNNLESRSTACLSTLDSGDEVWNNFADTPNHQNNGGVPKPVTFIQNNIPSSHSQKTSPYNLPPPPSFVRSNSVNSVNIQTGRALPAYRPPPAPQASGRIPYAHVPQSNIEFGSSSQQNFDPVRILNSAVPTASREEVLLALQACRDLNMAEKSLKIDQLMK